MSPPPFFFFFEAVCSCVGSLRALMIYLTLIELGAFKPGPDWRKEKTPKSKRG